MQKMDVIICTKDESHIRPQLMATLKTPNGMVSQIIVETSKPLSVARVIAAQKAKTSIIMYCDDDVEIPATLPEKYVSYMQDGVIAVSSQAYDANKHWLAYRRALYALYPNHHSIKGNFDNRAFIIRRDFMLDYFPPWCFHCEDTALAKAVRQKGKWVHLPFMGVWHYPHYRSWVPWGYMAQALRLNERPPAFGFAGRLLVSYISFFYTLDPRTLMFGLKFAVQWFSGYLMAKIDGDKK